ncbi:hypothetical protein GGR57DRAFT_465936 [Xylariaceae sp. FL1272]|nr:hypothetical protein GGR57DRAFT_465936 [Xylariaceae sp. FL1272]
MLLTPSLLLLAVLAAAIAVSVDYRTLEADKGDKLPDFSFCGYHSSNDPLPSTTREAADTLSPTSGDQSQRIQDALDAISSSGGGVLELKSGEYQLSKGVVIPTKTSLRGAGQGKTVVLPKNGSFMAFTMGTEVARPKPESTVDITDEYVPVGALEVTVKNASGLRAGQAVWIQRAVTQEWIDANGMATLPDPEDHWLTPYDTVFQPRTITAVSSNTVTLDIPLTDQLDRSYMSPKLSTYTAPAEASAEMGLESLSITLSPTCSGKIINDTSCKGSALSVLSWATDSYARSLAITGFNNAVKIAQNASRLTVQDVTITRDHDTDNGAGYAADISISGTQVLVVDSGTLGGEGAKSFPVVTQGLTPGPNAVVRYLAQQADMQIQPHAHWAHGLLIDNTTATTTLINRGSAGSGHGWAINSGVAWNVVGDYDIQSPPLGTNWGIGCRGGARGEGNNGTMVAEKETVEPISLFEAQLAARGKP